MAMQLHDGGAGGEPELMLDINTTPLIDVMLVLLIMLIVTVPIQLHAVNVDLPVGRPPVQQTEPNVLKVDVDATSAVFLDGEPIELPELERRFAELAPLPREAQPELHLRPHKDARYEVVAAVMAAVQRHGLAKFGIVGSEQFVQ